MIVVKKIEELIAEGHKPVVRGFNCYMESKDGKSRIQMNHVIRLGGKKYHPQQTVYKIFPDWCLRPEK